MAGRRMDLSATQVIASMLAAVTGAVAASYLGIAGTVVGAAIMSVASTVVASVYKHYIGRSRERLRAAREAARSAPLLLQHRATRPGLDISRAATRTDLSRAATRPGRPAGPDVEETQVLPAVDPGQHRWDSADRANGLADGATQIVPRPDHEGHGSPAGPPTTGGDAEPQDARWRRPRPLVLAGMALGVFLLAMGGITAFEALAGKPLDAIVGNGHGSGTTIGSIVGGSGGQTAPRHTVPVRPSQSPSPTSPAPTSPGPSPTPTPTPSPTPSPTQSPSPNDSPAASPAESPGASAGPAQTGSPLTHGAHSARSSAGAGAAGG